MNYGVVGVVKFEHWGGRGFNPWRRRTVGHRGDGPARRARSVDPDGLHAGGWHRGVWDAQLYLSS